MTVETTACAGAPSSGGGAVSSVNEQTGAVALTFTDLPDAPATITPKALLRGSDDGEGLNFATLVEVSPSNFNSSQNDAAPTGIDFHSFAINEADHGWHQGVATLQAKEGNRGLLEVFGYNDAGDGVGLSVQANGDLQTLVFDFTAAGPSAIPTIVGLDVAASDASARMTVAGTEYSIAKAIQVKIGSDTYFWPLFGPVAP